MLIEVGLLTVGLQKTKAVLNRFFTAAAAQPDADAAFIILDRYATVFNEIKVQPFLKGRCLSRSLAMQYALLRRGVSTDLRIGVNIEKGIFDAHAWLERKGIILNDHPVNTGNYFVLPSDKLQSALKFK
ncbi:hypothetical protein GCM10027037_05690 [Mucilaginibacter koreensis]